MCCKCLGRECVDIVVVGFVVEKCVDIVVVVMVVVLIFCDGMM